MLKGELNQILNRNKLAIEKIEKQQLEIITHFISKRYNIEKYDKILVDGKVVVVVGFDFKGTTNNLFIEYKRIRADGNMDNVTFSTPAKYYEDLGKYNGRL